MSSSDVLHGDSASLRPLVDDPAWVLERYREAKELLGDIEVMRVALPDDLRERVGDFTIETAMDTCTTLGPDCGCNSRRSAS